MGFVWRLRWSAIRRLLKKGDAMKNVVDRLAKVCAAVVCLAIAGCGMDSVQLGEYVKKEMQAELVKVDGLKSLQMKEVRLLQDDDVNYSGVGKGEVDGQLVKFDVKCKYDGKTVLWDASLSNDNLFSLATKEKAQEIYGKIKAGLKKTYDSASKKAGELYESAAKGTGKCIDSVKEKLTSE